MAFDPISYSELQKHKKDYRTLKGVADGSITPEMIQFIQPPRNLINKHTVEMYKGIDSQTGELYDDSSYCVTDFIPVEYGVTINKSNVWRFFSYNANFQLVGGSLSDQYTVTNPNIKFIRFVIYVENIDKAQANFGPELLPYEPYAYKLGYDDNFPFDVKLPSHSVGNEELKEKAVEPINTTFFTFSNNLFDKDRILNNTSIDLNSNIIEEQGRWLSNLIEVTPGETIHFTRGTYRIALYGEDGTPLSRSGVTDDQQYNIPSTTWYIRLSGTYDLNPPETVMVNRGDELLPYEPYYVGISPEYLPEIQLPSNSVGHEELKEKAVEPINTTFFTFSNNLFDKDRILNNTSIDLNSNIIEEQGRWLSNLIEVTPGETIHFTRGTYRIALYGEDGTPLSRSGVTDDQQYNIPSTTWYIRLSGTYDLNPPETVMVNRGDELLPYEPYYVGISPEYLPEIPEVDLEEVKTAVMKDVEQMVYQNLSLFEPTIPKLTWQTIGTGWRTPLWLSKDGEVVWGDYGGQLLQSTNEWATYEQVGTSSLPKPILGIRELDDGELLVSTARDEADGTKAKVYKTVGYDRNNPSATTFEEVLELNVTQADVKNSWGFSIYENIVLVSEYGLKGYEGARYVYLSTDYGETFNVIFDLYTQEIEGRPDLTMTAHVHTVAYDPYYNRIWLCVGDLPNTATYYSDDMGQTWVFVEGSNIMQYTGIIALPDSVIFGSDRGPNGIHVYRRKSKTEMPVIEPLYLINDNSSNTHVFELPFKRDWHPQTPVYFAATRAQGTEYRPVIMGLVDGKKAHLLWEADFEGDYTGNVWYALGATAQGNIIAYMSDPNINGYRIVKATAPDWVKM